jgi:hypothetical protein
MAADEDETEQDRRTREGVEKMGRDNGLFRHASPVRKAAATAGGGSPVNPFCTRNRK